MKYFLLAFFLLCAVAADAVPGSWRIHPSNDSYPERLIATPFGVYYFSLAEQYNPKVKDIQDRQGFLYRYDADADELEFLSSQGNLSESVVTYVEYNPEKGYLFINYLSDNIDLLADDGSVKNIPALKSAPVSGSKSVNSVSFDPSHNAIYVATAFGYLVINDEKGEVISSVNMGSPVKSVMRHGDTILLLSGDDLYAADAGDRQFALDDFQKVMTIEGARRLFSIPGGGCVISYLNSDNRYAYDSLHGDVDSGYTRNLVTSVNRPEVELSKDGIILGSGAQFILIDKNGVGTTVTRSEDDFSTLGSTADMKEYWYVRERDGIYSKKYDASNPDSKSRWTLTRQPMRPDASAAFKCTSMVWHPTYGLMVNNHGIDLTFIHHGVKAPVLLSALRDSRWEMHGLPYVNPDHSEIVYNPNGLAVDPDNPDFVYMSSMLNGMLRLNLADPSDLLHMASSYDKSKNLPGYVEMAHGNPWWTDHFSFAAPHFDNSGRLWSCYYNSQADRDGSKQLELWYWDSEDRKASKSASSFRPWKKIVIPGETPSNAQTILPLRHPSNDGIVLYAPNGYGKPVYVLDHNGTPGNTSDDRIVMLNGIYNQDGAKVTYYYVPSMYEDLETGTVWIGTGSGLFTFNPRKIFEDPSHVNNIKVSRDDGTDLADYLLNGSYVNAIASDGQGRKWFGTLGGGIVVTSDDGRKVLLELNSDNSPLPSDDIYYICYNPSANSMMISTSRGLVEYFPSGMSVKGDDLDAVRAYPNPVRSDYYGYVTIDGLVDNALVKIVDAMGNLVKEFDLASGGEVKWDVTNLSHKRVKTGVYYVLASSGPDNGSLSKVTKILVVN